MYSLSLPRYYAIPSSRMEQSMFGMNARASARMAELNSQIETLNRELAQSHSKARGFFELASSNASKIDDHFSAVLSANTQKTATQLAGHPPPRAAAWTPELWTAWDPLTATEERILRIGNLVDDKDKNFSVPAYVPFLGQNKTIIIRSKGKSTERGAALFQSMLIRTALMLPHKARYTLLDPAGHGIAFPMRRYLPHVRENTGEVRRDLDQVIFDIQRIIETYLDASVKSFESVPHELRVNERFQFVFAADFPNQYDRRAIEALQSISNTGTVAGVYLFIHYNQDHELPRDISMDGFNNAYYIDVAEESTHTNLKLKLRLDPAPPPELQGQLLQTLAAAKPPERSLDWDSTVGVPEEEWWQASSNRIIETSIGARGGGDRLNLWFGVNSNGQPCAHGILGAMTGSGKSNLYHVLICGLAIRYSPQELRMYLIDGKDGVEFQTYRNLPHAEVVSLRSSPELSRSVLSELVAEKERRNGIFARAGVADLTAYRNKGQPEGAMPRILLLVDEYQELFDGDRDGIASSQLLQLAQQGRSVGIHMLLASQRFGAAGMLNQTAIFGNFHMRIAMQMTTSDVQALTEFGRRGKALIMTCDLPGKIVVNDRSGDDNANQAGKVAYLTSERREQLLQKLIDKAKSLPDESLPRRVIFDGQRQPNLLENPYLFTLLRRESWPSAQDLADFARKPSDAGGLDIMDWFASEHPRVAWLGQQFSVRGQAVMVFRRRTAEHSMVIGGNHAARYGMLAALLTSLSVNSSPASTRFIIVDRSTTGAPWSDTLEAAYKSVLQPAGFDVTFSKESQDVENCLNDLSAELERRGKLREADLGQEPSVFVTMTELDGVQALRRRSDGYGGMSESPLGETLRRLIVEGAPVGIHFILSFAGVRPMAHVVDERRGLINFRHRIALQMSEDESHTFVRSRRASQLQVEGPTPVCALYVDVENDSSVRFKPYTSDSTRGDSLSEQLETVGSTLSNWRQNR